MADMRKESDASEWIKQLRNEAERSPMKTSFNLSRDEVLALTGSKFIPSDTPHSDWYNKINDAWRNVMTAHNIDPLDCDAIRVTQALSVAIKHMNTCDTDTQDSRDAARYRWLKKKKSKDELLAFVLTKSGSNEAIDAAMQADKEKGNDN